MVAVVLAGTLLVWTFGFAVRTVLPSAVMQGADITTLSARLSFWADRLAYGNPNWAGSTSDRIAFDREVRRTDPEHRAIWVWMQRCAKDEGSAAMLPVLEQLRELVWRERIGAAQRAASSYAELQIFTWLSIFTGLITMVLVAFSATEFGRGETPLARTIRALAVIFPVVGTSLAAVAAFYAPREELARASQLLASMRQTHATIVVEVAELACPHESPTARDAYFAAVRGWSRQVEQARAATEAAALSALRTEGSSQAGESARPK